MKEQEKCSNKVLAITMKNLSDRTQIEHGINLFENKAYNKLYLFLNGEIEKPSEDEIIEDFKEYVAKIGGVFSKKSEMEIRESFRKLSPPHSPKKST